MPGLVRRLLIFPTIDGLTLQSHGSSEHHKSIRVDYKTRRLTECSKSGGHVSKDDRHLESHGIVGLLNIASFTYLIAITRREQVAQIFGKPIFVVTDVALVPLSSQSEAREAIIAATESYATDANISDSDCSGSEDEQHSISGAELSSTPTEDEAVFKHKNESGTSIAEDVARRKAPYGKFASEWFVKKVWGTTPQPIKQPDSVRSSQSTHTSRNATQSTRPDAEEASGAADANADAPAEIAQKQDMSSDPVVTANASTITLLPKILRSVKMILSSRSFYFSYEFDLTRNLFLQGGKSQPPSFDHLDPLYFWNRRLGTQFLDAGQDAFLMPIVQGFVGQRTFTVKPKGNDSSDQEVTSSTSTETTASQGSAGTEKSFLITLISRRSTRRSGLRYLRRGIDDEGNCANAAETEQILSSPSWEKSTPIRSFVQVRGSIPLYFSQTPYALKPVPVFHNSPSANQAAFKRHFQTLKDRYGTVQIATLINKHGTEATIGDAYEKQYKTLHDAGELNNVNFEWFDFHSECRGMKFENVQRLVDKFASDIRIWGETVIHEDKISKRQSGIIRTNCMDCLDRTNVAQSAFGQHVLQQDLEAAGYDIDLMHDESTNWFNLLWADNGDAISRQYASTAALKGDFTRTRKRNWRGQMNDLGLTLSRYYSNMVNDYFSQAIIDVLLGNVSWRIFEDFESTMMSADPGVSVASAREAAIENCAKIVIQGQDEDLIHGWALLSPAQENTLRTFPFEETVVLLTDIALYCCKFDWNTEKVASYEKIDLRSISKIRFGTYITSTFTERQMREDLNQGLAILFTPGNGNVIRVNTRSLQNQVTPSAEGGTSVDGGTGVMSWFAPKNSSNASRTMAFKVIVQDMGLESEDQPTRKLHETPHAMAGNISEEIRRAIEGPGESDSVGSLLEQGDIISVTEAKRRTGYLEQLGHSIKRMVWT